MTWMSRSRAEPEQPVHHRTRRAPRPSGSVGWHRSPAGWRDRCALRPPASPRCRRRRRRGRCRRAPRAGGDARAIGPSAWPTRPSLDTTCTPTSSPPTRPAMRAARRMTASLPGAPVRATRTRSRVSHALGDVVVAQVLLQLVLDAVGHPQQRELAQRCQVAGPEVVRHRRVDALGRVHVAVGQAPAQRLGRHVDQLDLFGPPHPLVGHGLPLADAGDALDHVVDRLQVLDVDRRDDVDAGVEQLLDVGPALGVARTRRRWCARARRRAPRRGGAPAARRCPAPRARRRGARGVDAAAPRGRRRGRRCSSARGSRRCPPRHPRRAIGADGPRRASRRSCRRPGLRRGRCAADRDSRADLPDGSVTR